MGCDCQLPMHYATWRYMRHVPDPQAPCDVQGQTCASPPCACVTVYAVTCMQPSMRCGANRDGPYTTTFRTDCQIWTHLAPSGLVSRITMRIRLPRLTCAPPPYPGPRACDYLLPAHIHLIICTPPPPSSQHIPYSATNINYVHIETHPLPFQIANPPGGICRIFTCALKDLW